MSPKAPPSEDPNSHAFPCPHLEHPNSPSAHNVLSCIIPYSTLSSPLLLSTRAPKCSYAGFRAERPPSSSPTPRFQSPSTSWTRRGNLRKVMLLCPSPSVRDTAKSAPTGTSFISKARLTSFFLQLGSPSYHIPWGQSAIPITTKSLGQRKGMIVPLSEMGKIKAQSEKFKSRSLNPSDS